MTFSPKREDWIETVILLLSMMLIAPPICRPNAPGVSARMMGMMWLVPKGDDCEDTVVVADRPSTLPTPARHRSIALRLIS
jgi:hypothetical protein